MRSIILIAALLAGCSTPRLMPASQPTDPATLEVIERLYAGKRRIGKVEGLSCDRGFFFTERGTYEEALGEAKLRAAELGATGIANVRALAPKDIFSCRTQGGVRVTAVAYE